jgi:hypothetical protein
MTRCRVALRIVGPAIAACVIAVPSTAAAQCSSSAGLTCSRIDPAQFEFGVETPPQQPTLNFFSPPPAAVFARAARPPADCAMVKPVDPKFASTMPVLPADAKRQLPMTIVHVPPCKN